jgi:hypothetical protein
VATNLINLRDVMTNPPAWHIDPQDPRRLGRIAAEQEPTAHG